MQLLWLLLALIWVAAAGRRPNAPAEPGLWAERARRARALVAEATVVSGFALREWQAVRDPAARLYRGAQSSFVESCARRRLDWTSRAALDQTLVQCMGSESHFGGGSSQDIVLLAAVALLLGPLRERTAVLLLRAHRAAAAWACRSPARSRLPLPRWAVFPLAGLMLRGGCLRLVVCVLVVSACYLGP